MTKGLSRKQIIVPISLGNSNKFIVLSNKHISNISRVLKDIKLDVLADFIWANDKSLTITTNDIMLPRLPQLGISYLIEDMNISITSDIIIFHIYYMIFDKNSLPFC